jgi:hypothetical protein
MKTRVCPNCGIKIIYKREDNYQSGVTNNTWCRRCSSRPASRNCPQCNQLVTHTNRYNCIKAIKKNKICRKCVAVSFSKKYSGNNNPFAGKKHTPESLKKMKNKDMSYTQTEAFRKRRKETSKNGKDNPMWGKSVYEFWLDKHGKQEADRLLLEYKKKQSINNAGKNNNMYGKPTPQGSGNGWSGWYKGWFFRSIRELSYIFNVLEKDNLKWRSAETKDLTIKYVDWHGKERNYNADFLVEERYLVEIKPEKLKSSKTVRLKQEFAIAFCNEKGLEYQLIDPPLISTENIINLYKSGYIKFIDRYEKIFKKRYLND